MQKTILASVIIMSLSACDSDSLSLTTEDGAVNSTGNTAVSDTAVSNTIVATDSTVTDANTGTTVVANNETTNGGTTVVVQTPLSDDAGSSTSDGGQTADNGSKYDTGNTADTTVDASKQDPKDVATPISDDAGSSTSDGGQTISDDAGSSTSDGGQTISDDAGSSSSDGGQTISDDGGSSTSDGGISADAGSSTSDGGQIADDAASGSSDGGQTPVSTQGTRNTDAGSFASDNSGGTFIRQSSLATVGSNQICTTANSPNDYSDIRFGDFIVHNNAWRTFRAAPGYQWEQCVYTNQNGAATGWTYDWGPGITGINGSTSPSGDFYVRSYPELIFGVKDEFRSSAPQSETGFPVRLSQMPNIQIDYSYDGPQYGDSRTVDASNNPRFPNGTTISGERNVAIESFFYEADAAGNCSEGIVTRSGGSNHVYEVMVWLDAGAERLPAGPNDFVADLDIRGNPYKVYTKGSDPRYIAFVAQNPQTTGTVYWNDYTDWARDNAHLVRERFGARSNSVQIQDDWCVANILVGTEIFWGAGNIDFYEWTITQTR